MVWRGDIEKHYNNVTKTYDVLNLIDNDDIELKNGLRAVIMKELIKSCECLIEWLDDDSNVNCKIARLFIESIGLGYDVCIIIEARNFIYELLGKPLSELLNIRAGE